MYDLLVIGGGPSGMMAAGRAASLGAKVALLEKNKELGRKLLLTGGGRCNITNAEFDTRKFLENFGDTKRFLFSPFSRFSVRDTFSFFEEIGVPLVVEEGKRVFPRTERASDVRDALLRFIEERGVDIRTMTKVLSINKGSDALWQVETIKGTFTTKRIAIATGGLAVPETGSTGDGFRFLASMGHAIRKPSADLVPLISPDAWAHELAGVTLSDVGVRFLQEGKVRLRRKGPILFTHFGISGPTVLHVARAVKMLLGTGAVFAAIDLFPGMDEGVLRSEVLARFEAHRTRAVKNILADMMPRKVVVALLGMIDRTLLDRRASAVTKEERIAIVHRMKDIPLRITGTLGFEKAIYSEGGVYGDEVDWKRMCSKFERTVYVLGDVLDVPRPSGGFSLQICWTTGWIAGTDVLS